MQSLYERQIETIVGGLGVAPPGKLTIVQGEPVRMTVAFRYRGPALPSATLRCSIGTRIVGIFYESVYASKNIGPIPQSSDFLDYTAYADIATAGLSPSVNYDVEAKISEYAAQTLVKHDDVIDVIGAPEFQNFRITDYSKV